GLGVGIDYALFLVTRHRQQVMDGADPVEAAARTVGTSGRSVLVAASTVIIAVLGLYASGIGFIGKLGLAASITVAVAALGAVTLVPALLGLAGAGIDRRRVRRRPVAEAAGEHPGWQRYAERVGAHPWRFLAAGIGLLLVLAIPVLSMHIGHVDDGADPPRFTDRRAYDALTAGFGVGANGPLQVVVDLGPAGHDGTLPQSLRTALQQTTDVASVSPVTRSGDGAILTATVIPKTAPQSTATLHLLRSLQDGTLPRALGSSGATGYVTGSLAGQLEFRDQLADRLPLVIATVIAAAFVLLLLSFRSPLLALKAGLLNLLSIGAAYGVLVAVFQWGWGGPALGVNGTVPIESYVPMIMFAIVFGLSMDYEVFLLSRVRDVWNRTGDNHRAVAGGLAATARVITGAALIITSVFLAFLLSPVVVVKMLALGLGVSILVDATVIRLVVVPATMFLLGRANWWTPGWLRHLPDLLEPVDQPEPAVPPVREPAPAAPATALSGSAPPGCAG
ncbi:MAG TPA: MMPL family transporter, partial [Acidimicrobiales bacterium]|nr:MMPL family transporter [Acidimicrobiales bacterium]